MKEYKVVAWKVNLTSNNEKLEDTLNQYAKQGWKLLQLNENFRQIVFERDKNR